MNKSQSGKSSNIKGKETTPKGSFSKQTPAVSNIQKSQNSKQSPKNKDIKGSVVKTPKRDVPPIEIETKRVKETPRNKSSEMQVENNKRSLSKSLPPSKSKPSSTISKASVTSKVPSVKKQTTHSKPSTVTKVSTKSKESTASKKGSAGKEESATKESPNAMTIEEPDEKPKQRGWKKIKYYGDAENKKEKDGMVEEGKECEEAELEFPYWLKEENLRDKKQRKIGQEGYDPSTLFVPEDELKGCTPVMRQYWEIKMNHFDKLVAFKLWKFYFFYYNDGLAVHRLLDTGLHVDGKRFFTYFHESNMPKYAPKILQAGHKVVVVEQMEDVFTKSETLVKREVCQILTRGTYTESLQMDYASRFILCIFEHEYNFGITYVDTTTHEFYLGEFVDDYHRSSLRTLLTRIKPVEIIYLSNYISIESLQIFRGLAQKPTLTPSYNHNPRYLFEIFDTMKKYFKSADKSDKIDFPDYIEKIYLSLEANLKINTRAFEIKVLEIERKLPFYFSMQALGICLAFLEGILLAETVFSMGAFLPFDLNIEKQATLYLDSQALINLEILDVTYLNSLTENSSLFGHIDRTATPFGRRMLKRWLTSPLMDPEKINERLDAVEDLMKNPDITDFFHDRISKFPDFERMINRVYNLSHKQRMSAAYFEDFAKNRLKEFLTLLSELKKVEKSIEFFGDYVEYFRCKRLVQLTTFKDIDIEAFKDKKKSKKKSGGIFPKIKDIISDLEAMVKVKDGLPMPAPGVSKANDELLVKIDVIRAALQKYLDDQRKKFNSKDINFVHARLRYELEIPEHLVKGSLKPKNFVVTSKRSGYLRFHTPEIEGYMGDLFRLENEFQQILIDFIVIFFKKFYERHSFWQQVVSCLAELDCLCSLAKLARSMPVKCRPTVLPAGKENIFELKGMIHPTISKRSSNFVPNDVIYEDSANIFLITGPNMGGKSTLLRQTCIAVIMAQLGSYIPATSFKLSAKDRIFTRIGAMDRILEGKSTFFVEMEETYSIVKEATNDSLLVIDELGRGTSTYDGIAIAYAVLKYTAEHLNCITMFATHYHLLLEEFKLYKNIGTYVMQADFNEETDELKFLYKFIKGKALNSHGTIMAKHAGLPDEVVEKAKEKAAFMTKEKKNIGFEKNLAERFNKTIDQLARFASAQSEVNVETLLNELSQL